MSDRGDISSRPGRRPRSYCRLRFMCVLRLVRGSVVGSSGANHPGIRTGDRGPRETRPDWWNIPWNADGTHRALAAVHHGSSHPEADIDSVGRKAREKIQKLLGRSLSIREVDAGSCNGCELEIVALNNPIYDIERFGTTSSHLLVMPTCFWSPVLSRGTWSWRVEDISSHARTEVSRRFTPAASAAEFGENYASLGGVDKVVLRRYVPGVHPGPKPCSRESCSL